MNKIYQLSTLIIILTNFSGSMLAQSSAVQLNKSIIHKVYLIGDAGGLDDYTTGSNVVLDQVKKDIATDTLSADVVFLGDNIYPAGLHAENSPQRKKEEQIIDAHIAVAAANKGKTYIIPGNHDWNDATANGAAVNKLQYKYIKDKSKGMGLKYYPKKSCGDPEVVEINKDLVYIFIDSQWWLHDWSTEDKINKGCNIKSRLSFVEEMERIIADYKNDHIVFFMHHPFKSDGHHGARFSLKSHLLPLPVLGSLMPLARKMGITPQDNTNADHIQLYQSLQEAIILAGANSTFFISGHDHNLQYFYDNPLLSKSKQHYIVSGSGYKQGYVSKQGDALFSSNERGYQILDFYRDGSIRLTVKAVNKDSKESSIIYDEIIVDEDINRLLDEDTDRSFDSIKASIKTAPNKDLEAGPFYRLFFGNQYRKLWGMDVDVPVMDLSTHMGGLTPVKLGGGLSSNSLRVEDKEGKEFILRSIKKDFRKLIPEESKKLVWIDYYADQNASAIPYGALMLKHMSDAVEIYHTDPTLFYLPHQPSLKQYNDRLGEGLYIFEKRPDGKLWSDAPHFGHSKKIIGTPDVIEKLADKKSHSVDQSWVLKSRLFDMIIHDWDRHEDQWRWARYKDEDRTSYRPIPRDRDWAFYKSKGLLYAVMNGLYIKKFKSFKKELKDVQNFNLSAKHFDRFFMNGLEWAEWEKQIAYLQKNLTEEVIKQSIQDLPMESREYVKDEVLPKLINRVATLDEIGKKYYTLINEKINIIGTYDEDIFTLTAVDKDNIRVQHQLVKKDGTVIDRYDRVLSKKLTKELYIFGRSNEDQLIINGDISAIDVFFVGGSGADLIETKTAQDKLVVYDEPSGITLDKELIKQAILTDDIELNKYNYRHFMYNTLLPTFTVGSTFDEGLWFGIGLTKTNYGFKQFPYQIRHQLDISAAPFTRNAFTVDYAGSFKLSRSNNWFLEPSAYWHNPDYINFFGLENELSPIDDNRGFNWVKLKRTGGDIMLSKNILTSPDNVRFLRLSLGPNYESIQLNRNEDRVAGVYELPENTLQRWNHFLGATASVEMQALDNTLYPKNGFKLAANTGYTRQFSSGESDFSQVQVDLSIYLTPINSWSLILASRASYQQTFGDPLWYQQPSLGVNNYLRPFRNDRYRGTRMIVQQTELRKELFTWNNRIFPFTLGVNAGIDYAYVTNNASNNTFHHGYVAGLSFNVLDLFLLNTNVTQSEEEVLFMLSTGMSF